MGRVKRPRPRKLGEKLLKIRSALGVSQNEMLRVLGWDQQIDRSAISDWENDVREPPLPLLLRYAQVVNVYVDSLIDDGIDLPDELPCDDKSDGIRRRRSKR